MKFVRTNAAWIGLAVLTGGSPLLAQLRNNSEKTMTCQNGGDDRDGARFCEVREQTVASMGHLDVDASPNGGVTVKGWLRGDTLVRTRVETHGQTQAEAANLATQVAVNASGGQVRATGPSSGHNNSWWSVSYEIFVPQTSDVNLKSINGGITLSDVRGQIHFDVVNGGVTLRRLAGDVSGATVNGGITAELTGAIWEGRQMELRTNNGGVTIKAPSAYSAHVQAETGMGGIHSDFGNLADNNDRARTHQADFNIGSGGPLIHVTTNNGGITVKRVDAQ
jgi:DUF4097 and DUF4098 domain-containing protein YvlB